MKRLIVATLTLCLFAVTAFAQSNTGRLTGTVSDPSGVVPGATVEVTDNATSKSQTATTSGEGSFTVPQLEVGTYTVKVSAPGHKTFTATNLKIDVGQDYSLPVTLEVGDVSANVTVIAGADIVNSSSGELNNTVSPRQVQELPLNGRNPLALLTLQPGTASNGATNTSVNGQRPSFTNITRDGLNIQDNFIRSNASDFAPERPSVDNTAEFTVTTQNAGADRGYGASQIQLVTPRGANDFHGAGFEYNRNSAYGANSFFNNLNGTKRPFRNRNQFGGRVGGPIIKNKLFFFGFYEGVRDIRTSNQTRTVLTNNARNGLFSFNATCTSPTDPDPTKRCPAGVTNGQLITTNIFGIPQSVPTGATAVTGIDALIQSRFLANIPTGNRTDIGDQRNTTGFGFVQGQNLTRNQFTTRIDYDINDRNSINGVYTWTNESNQRPDVDQGGSGFLVGGGGFKFAPEVNQPAPNRFLALAYRMSPTATFTNEVRGGFYKSSPTFNRSTAQPDFFVSLPTIGGSQIGNPEVIFNDQGRFTKYYNIQDNAEYIRGNHSLRFGGQGQFFKINPFGPGAFSNTLVPTFVLGTNTNTPQFATTNFTALGGISSSQLTDANALLSLLGGIVGSGSVAFNATAPDSGFVKGATPNRLLKTENYSLYGQDQWRVGPHFTLNLGLRYELFTPVKEANRLALEPLIPQNADPVQALLNPNTLYDFVGANANSDNRYFKFDKNNFAPVVSFAWTPEFNNGLLSSIFPGSGKSVIRGGYRVSYVNDEFVRAADNLNSNAGLQSTASAVNSAGSSSLNARFGSLPGIAQPAFQVPRSFNQNFVLGGRGNTATSDVIAIDPNLKVSSSTEYNISYQREIGFQTAVEFRYVGGRSNNLVRGTNINQLDITRNGFAADFNRARANFVATGNAFCTGGTCQPLSFFTAASATSPVRLIGPSGTTTISNATFINNLNAGTPADLALSFVINNAANGFPLLPNPNARDIILLNNSGQYRYNSFQMEFRRRFTQGLAFQANYTFQKTLTDAQGVGQTRIDPLLDINRPQLDYVRADYDQTHIFNFNGIYELPIGKGHHFLNQGGVLNQIIGGWQVTGIMHLGTGAPITITDARGTINRAGRAGRQTPNSSLTKEQIKALFSVHRVANGVLFIDPSITSGGRGAGGFGTATFPGQVFFNAAPGDTGYLERAFINGPKYFDIDAALFKTFPIGERLRFIIRAEAFNLLNRANFFLGNTTSVNSVNFGRITSTFDPRVVQLAGRIEF
jgi:hypothetical protein